MVLFAWGAGNRLRAAPKAKRTSVGALSTNHRDGAVVRPGYRLTDLGTGIAEHIR